jgi:peptidoglycan/LPS O-acetylase OafA/YrhL
VGAVDGQEKKRIPGLDGLRGAAIVLTIWLHLSFGGFAGVHFPLGVGRVGVCLFFALSGFLITNILLAKPYTFKNFFWRRSLRIFPAFYAYLAFMVLLTVLGFYRLQWLSILAAGTYTINWANVSRGWPLMHTWSLSVEEQFYVIWPLALLLIGRRWAPAVLAGFLAAWPVQKFIRKGVWGDESIGHALERATYDSIVWGCLFAFLSANSGSRLRGLCCRRAAIYFPLFVLASQTWMAQSWPLFPFAPMRNLALAWIIFWVTENSQSWLVQMLQFKPLVWLGTRSYSLYLWHMPLCDSRLANMINWPTAVLLSLAAAELSYRLIEQPVLRWRDAGERKLR